jgi:hypothetical protein
MLIARAWTKIKRIALGFLCAYLLLACTPTRMTLVSPPSGPFPSPSAPNLPTKTNPTDPAPAPTQPAVTQVFQGPLSVTINAPLDNATVHASPVEISGRADPGTVVTLNDHDLLIDASGAFRVQLPLEAGANLIEITASDAQNNQGFAYLTIHYEP